MQRAVIAHIPQSHLDLFWLGNYKVCLERGADVIRQYLDRCHATEDETFLLETGIFAEQFLARYPAYRPILRALVQAGRVEIGAAYIDRWEHLTQGESHIRNIQLGKRWYRAVFGDDNQLVAHPDLPGLVPQIAQIYAQAGIKYYVTSRKVYEHGAVWRYRAPDGSALLMLNWPRHYVYVPLDLADVPAERRAALWVSPLDIEATQAGFPQGVIPLSGGAGDLADRDTFRQRYGRYLEEFVAANRERYPDLAFTYTVPTRVLAPYDASADVPVHSGEAPSVWGIGIGEEGCFFARDRVVESVLLTAETLVALAEHLGIAWRPPTSASWQGAFYDGAFFRATDPIPVGHELRELWRLHIITHDHNGGGQEGKLSSFQKRSMQDRCQRYAREIIDEALDHLAQRCSARGDCLVVFNPHGHAWSGPLGIALSDDRWTPDLSLHDDAGDSVPIQYDRRDGDQTVIQARLPTIPPLGYRIVACGHDEPSAPPSDVQVVEGETDVQLRSAHLDVVVDRATGALIRLLDRRRDHDWGSPLVGRVYALRESGNDVALQIDTATPPAENVVVGLDSAEVGPLFARVHIHKRLLHADIEQTVTLWADEARVDLETRIFWWGAHDWHVRLDLPSVAEACAITYGSPFYSAGWTDVMPEAAPRNRDEVRREDYPHYREAQGWLHLQAPSAGLTLCTPHPAFHHDAGRLAALLMRTAQSCGDARLHWEHAGEQCYAVVIRPGEPDWRAARAQHHGAMDLKPPVARLTQADGEGPLLHAVSYLQVQGDAAALSSVYPGDAPGHIVARLYDADGRGGTAQLTGPFAEGDAHAVDLLDEHPRRLEGSPGNWRVTLPPWRIQTVELRPERPDPRTLGCIAEQDTE